MIPPEFQTAITVSKMHFLLAQDTLELSRLLHAEMMLCGANNLQMVNFVPAPRM